MSHVGIFGRTKCGKTTLAHKLEESYAKRGISSIVLDINGEDWSPLATVFDDKEEFLECVWNSESCMIFIDEAGETVDRDKTLSSLFTRSRHNGHTLHVMGHSGMQLLPVQRQQISHLYLFKQTKKVCQTWVEEFGQEKIMEAQFLAARFEFLHCTIDESIPPTRKILKI